MLAAASPTPVTEYFLVAFKDDEEASDFAMLVLDVYDDVGGQPRVFIEPRPVVFQSYVRTEPTETSVAYVSIGTIRFLKGVARRFAISPTPIPLHELPDHLALVVGLERWDLRYYDERLGQ